MCANKKQELKAIKLPDAVWKSIGILFVLVFVVQTFLLLNQERRHLNGRVERTLAVIIDSIFFLIAGIVMFAAPVSENTMTCGCNRVKFPSRRKTSAPHRTRGKGNVTETLNADGSTTVQHEVVNSDGTRTVCVMSSLY
mmetsp:Transcript_9702/g.13589  ORF Transcript_9702/g.13589 Transcript_9702/m.13589 type:complete len:139 (-) Transcript_9702:518-934(-)